VGAGRCRRHHDERIEKTKVHFEVAQVNSEGNQFPNNRKPSENHLGLHRAQPPAAPPLLYLSPQPTTDPRARRTA